MEPSQFKSFMQEHGNSETYEVGRVFHSQDFDEKVFWLKSGYVKRYQARQLDHKVLELIYGPGHIISLSQLYKHLFGVDQNQSDFLYVYQAMTDIELLSIDAEVVVTELGKNPELYKDFFYESGLKLRSNIFRLASNSIKGSDQRIAHQLVSLAYEFAGITNGNAGSSVILPLPQSATDLAEQLNLPEKAVQGALDNLTDKKLLQIRGSSIKIMNVEHLKDVYL
jgi:CRP/FNR family cyclic AMP-dependent transcriptional regulator